MNIFKTSGCAAIGAAMLIACTAGNQFPGYEKSPTGLYSKFYVTNEGGRKPKTGEYAAISIKYTNSKDSVLFNSFEMKQAENGVISQPIFGPTFKGSLEEAFMSMAEGDSASFKISADSVYLKTFGLKELPKFVEKGSLLTFYVKLYKVKTQQELVNEMSTKESRQRDEFIRQNNITAQPTETGLYYIEKEAGKGAEIKAGQTASVKYVGKFLNGKVFDASEMHDGKPIEVPVAKGQVIPGWDEALQKMKKGGKAMLIVPSSLGYGTQGSGPIPPFSTLVFEIEVVDVK